MTETQAEEPTTTPVEPEEQRTEQEPAPAEIEPQEAEQSGNREAAKYRKQLRDTQSELEQARSKLAAAQSSIINTAVSDLRVLRSMQLRPEAVRELDTTGMFNTDGTVDTRAVQAQLDALYKDRPYLFQKNLNGTMIIPNEGKYPEKAPNMNAFENAFRPNSHV